MSLWTVYWKRQTASRNTSCSSQLPAGSLHNHIQLQPHVYHLPSIQMSFQGVDFGSHPMHSWHQSRSQPKSESGNQYLPLIFPPWYQIFHANTSLRCDQEQNPEKLRKPRQQSNGGVKTVKPKSYAHNATYKKWCGHAGRGYWSDKRTHQASPNFLKNWVEYPSSCPCGCPWLPAQ